MESIRLIGKVGPLNYRTVRTEEKKDMGKFTLPTSRIFIFINYHYSNNFYKEILVQDTNTYIMQANLQTLLPNTWVISDLSTKISIFLFKEDNIFIFFEYL